MPQKECRGIVRPIYKNETHIQKNPAYGNDPSQEEFIIYTALVETDALCIDCKKKECDDATRKEEIELWRA